jgi:hypothetical protein
MSGVFLAERDDSRETSVAGMLPFHVKHWPNPIGDALFA